MTLLKQIFRFTIVGGLAFLVDYCVLWALVDFFMVNYLMSTALSFSVSVVFNYVLSTVWVFECTEDGNKAANFVVFVVLSVIGLFLNLAIMWFAVDILLIHYLLAKICATGIVMVYNFVSRKLILENNRFSKRPTNNEYGTSTCQELPAGLHHKSTSS